MRSVGTLPQLFDGNRARAQDFIDEVKAYLYLNRNVVGYNSPIFKVAFTLMHIKGKKVAGWVYDMGDWLDTLDPILKNVPDMWHQFLEQFATKFLNSSAVECAYIKLESIKITYPYINNYITKFEDVLRWVGYTWGSPEMIIYFTCGLSPWIMEDVVKPPQPQMYQATVNKAIEIVKSQ